MTELATLSRPYANALFDLATEAKQLEEWSKTMATLDAAANDATVALMLSSPEFTANDKAKRLATLCADEVSSDAERFLQALAEHDRLGLIQEVREQYEALRAEQERSLEVEIISARALTESQEALLVSALEQKFDKEISSTVRIDEALVGGAVIRAGDVIIDGSVRGRLTKLVDTLVQS